MVPVPALIKGSAIQSFRWISESDVTSHKKKRSEKSPRPIFLFSVLPSSVRGPPVGRWAAAASHFHGRTSHFQSRIGGPRGLN